MADETSNAVIESDITQTVSDGINSLDPKEGVMEHIYLFIYLFIYLSIYLFVYLSMNSILISSIRMSIYSLSI